MTGRANFVMLLIAGGLLTFYLVDPAREGGVGSPPRIALELFPDFEPLDADRIVVSMPDKTTEVVREGDTWKMVPSEYPVSTERVETVLDKIATLSKGTIASRSADSLERLGVAGNGREIVVYGEGDAPLVHFYVGHRGRANRRTFVRKEGVDEVLAVLDEDLHKVFHPAAVTWYESVDVLKFDSKIATELALEGPEGAVRFARDENADWVQTAPEEREADQARVTGVVRALASLQFVDVAAPDAAEDFGFEPPTLRMRVRLADDTEHEVLVGGTSDDGSQRFLRRPDESAIFVVAAPAFDNAFLRSFATWLELPAGDSETSDGGASFSGPTFGADFIRAILNADVLVDAVADPAAIGDDGSPSAAPAEGEDSIDVLFRVTRVHKGDESLPDGVADGSVMLPIRLPVGRQLPDLRESNGVHLIFLKGDAESGFRLAGDPVDTLVQPDPQTRAQLGGVLQQMKAAQPPKPKPGGGG